VPLVFWTIERFSSDAWFGTRLGRAGSGSTKLPREVPQVET